MSGAARHVELFRLRTAHRGCVTRTVHTLEDALRIASFPDSDGRLIVIRSLQLGRIGASLSSAAMARVVEEAVRRAGFKAVSAFDEAAPVASAVYFNSPIEALVYAATLIARGRELGEWYWARVIPGITAQAFPVEAFLLILRAALRLAPQAAAAAFVVQQLIASRAAEALLAALTLEHGSLLLQQFGWRPAWSRPVAPVEMASFRITPRWVEALRRHVPGWTPADPRSQWLVSLAIVSTAPAESSHSRLPELAVTLAHCLLRSPAEGLPSTASVREPHNPALSITTAVPSGEPATVIIDTNDVRHVFCPLESPARKITNFGGLFFLIPVLYRLGIPLTAPSGFGPEFFLDFSRRLGIPDEDPILSAIAPPEEPVSTPDQMRDWRNAIRRWTRRNLRFGLHTLIHRTATVLHQPLLLDVTFPLDTVDLRIRKQALDADPGWVPWLGCVIHFHYGPETP